MSKVGSNISSYSLQVYPEFLPYLASYRYRAGLTKWMMQTWSLGVRPSSDGVRKVPGAIFIIHFVLPGISCIQQRRSSRSCKGSKSQSALYLHERYCSPLLCGKKATHLHAGEMYPKTFSSYNKPPLVIMIPEPTNACVGEAHFWVILLNHFS